MLPNRQCVKLTNDARGIWENNGVAARRGRFGPGTCFAPLAGFKGCEVDGRSRMPPAGFGEIPRLAGASGWPPLSVLFHQIEQLLLGVLGQPIAVDLFLQVFELAVAAKIAVDAGGGS